MANKITIIVIALIVGLILVAKELKNEDYKKKIQENEKLRESLLKKEKEVVSLRTSLASQRQALLAEINKSANRFDSLEKLHAKNESKLQKELSRIKGSNVKDLQNEAEHIYSIACQH